MNNIILMADGTGSRWDHPEVTFKHLIDVNGTPLIARTVKQIKKYHPKTNIICVAPEEFEAHLPGIPVTTLGYRDTEKRPLLDGILRTKPFWTEETVILLGDVIFSELAIKWLFTVEFSSWILGRTTQNKVIGKKAGELFSWSFNHTKEPIEYNIRECLKDKKCSGKLWDYYWRHRPSLVELNDYTDDIDSPQAYVQFYPRLLKAVRNDK
jgi:hypothetical protein